MTDHDVPATPFGAALGPALLEACAGRLSDLSWFRTDWQRGGALTGYATYQTDCGATHPVVVKLPVPPCERAWLMNLQRGRTGMDVAPRLYAHGDALAGYDMCWVVMERLPYGPLGPRWGGREFDLLVEAAGRFQAAANEVPIIEARGTYRIDWAEVLDDARRHVQDRAVPEPQRWKAALKKASRKLDAWLSVWDARPQHYWCHGDLHLGNAMSRQAPEEEHGSAVLIDYANIHLGHWVEDAIYLEHLYWGTPNRLGADKLCSRIAKERKRQGLDRDSMWPEYAQIKRALTAMSAPAKMAHDGSRTHLAGAVEVLERLV